jgi:hypothetical protein
VGGSRTFGVYKGSLVGREGRGGSFRLLLFAELPDRLHAEVLPPVGGGPRLILDGGQGRLAVALVDERVAYVGDSGADTVGKAIGARISLGALVGFLLTGTESERSDLVMVREPAAREGLPDVLEIRSSERVLRIERRGRAPVAASGSALGSGTPPQGFTVHSLADLDVEEGQSVLDREAGS